MSPTEQQQAAYRLTRDETFMGILRKILASKAEKVLAATTSEDRDHSASEYHGLKRVLVELEKLAAEAKPKD